jgi:hypothetical protein
MTIIYHNNAGLDLDKVAFWDFQDGTNLRIWFQGVNTPLTVPVADGKGQSFVAQLQSKGTLVKPPAATPAPGH